MADVVSAVADDAWAALERQAAALLRKVDTPRQLGRTTTAARDVRRVLVLLMGGTLLVLAGFAYVLGSAIL